MALMALLVNGRGYLNRVRDTTGNLDQIAPFHVTQEHITDHHLQLLKFPRDTVANARAMPRVER